MTQLDRRQAAIERAVKVKALQQLAREIGINEALAAVTTATVSTGTETATPREVAAAGRRAHRAKVVAEIIRLEMDGRGWGAAKVVALRYVADKHDPIEVESMAHKFLTWRRAENRTHVQSPSSKSDRS